MKKLHIILMILGILTIALSTFFTSPLLVSADPDYDEFCYLAHVLNGATGRGWSHALLWFESYPP